MASTVISRTAGLVGEYGIKAPCRVATTAAIALSGEQTIDGVAVSANIVANQPPDRVLVKDMADTTLNGIYAVSTTAWVRSADFDGPGDAQKGTLVYVTDGATNGGHLWKCTTANPINIGGDSASNITFADASITGPAGQTILSGAGVPSSGTGVNGDFYIDTTAHAIYGPKTAGAWGSSTSLTGPTGATGATGATGPKGDKGDTGGGLGEVSDGSTDLTSRNKLTFSGAVVTDLGSGVAGVAITPGAGGTVTPQGRLTLQSGAPVMTADQTAKATIFYDTYTGQIVPVWNGSSFDLLTITADEVSLVLDSTHHLLASLYDVFAIKSSGALKLVTGPAWSSGTARGSGAGTTELQRKNGVWTNKNSLTHAWNNNTDFGAVSANQGTYLGTFYATANGQTGCAFKPAAAGGGTNNILGLYNAYNRVRCSALCRDNTSTWTYATATWRGANGSASNRISWVDGLQQSAVEAKLQQLMTSGDVSVTGVIGIDLDSTSAAPGAGTQSDTTTGVGASIAESFLPQLGFHFLQGVEYATGATITFYGSATFGSAVQLNQLSVEVAI